MSLDPELHKAVSKMLNDRYRAGQKITWVRFRGNTLEHGGMPEFLVVLDGRAFGIALTPKHELSKLRRAGATTAVCRSVAEVERVLDGAPTDDSGN